MKGGEEGEGVWDCGMSDVVIAEVRSKRNSDGECY